MAIKAGSRHTLSGYMFLNIIAALGLLQISCGQDPSFQTKEAGIASGDATADIGGDDTILNPENPEDRKKQAQYCQEEGINDEDCFNYKMVTMNSEQPAPGKVDILWIVDNSGSMSEEQAYLGNNFSNFIERLHESDIDFQVAVSTTDVCQDQLPAALEDRRCPDSNGGFHHRGSFVGTAGNKVLKDSTPNLFDTFKSYAKVGINGSGFEHGLKGAEMAVAKVLSGENEALIRDNSFLAIIVVSDEEDDGIGLSMKDAYTGKNFWNEGKTRFKFTDDNLIEYLQGVKGEGKFSVSTIAPTIDPNTGKVCSSAHSQPQEVGTQYIKAAEKTGGIIQSICEANWDTALSNIGEDLGAQITQIKLKYPAEAATIKVFVNNQVDTHWTYIPASNAVKFDLNHIPAAGAQIKVEYLTKY